jgi:hypothetical protein
MSQQTYYGIQSGASFMNGMMDAYNRAVGMQANIVQYENQMRRQNTQDARQVRMDDLSIKQMEFDQKYKTAATELSVAGASSDLALKRGEIAHQRSLAAAKGMPVAEYDRTLKIIDDQIGNYSTFSGNMGFGTQRTAVTPTAFAPKPVTGETVPYKSQIYGESPIRSSMTFASPEIPSTVQTPAKPLTEADIAVMTFKNSEGKIGTPGKYLFSESIEDGDKEVDAVYNALNQSWWRPDKDGNPQTEFTPKPIPITPEQMKLGTDAIAGPAKEFVSELDNAATSDHSFLANESFMNTLLNKHLNAAQAAVGDSTSRGLTKGVQKKISRYALEEFKGSVKGARNLTDNEKSDVIKRIDNMAIDTISHTLPLVVNGNPTNIQVSKDTADSKFFEQKIDSAAREVFPTKVLSDQPAAGIWERIASQLLKPTKAVVYGATRVGAGIFDTFVSGTPAKDIIDLKSQQADNAIAPHTKLSVLTDVVAQAGPIVDTLYAGDKPGEPESKGQNKSILQQMARGITVQNPDGTTRELDIENPEDREVLKVYVSKNLELATYKLAEYNIGTTTPERLGSLWNKTTPFKSRVAEPENQPIRKMGYGYGGY